MRVDLVSLDLRNDELLSDLRSFRGEERKLQCRFLAHLAEVEKRQLYAIEGYSSLFRFVTESLGYSESSALKRIQVARVARRFPLIYYSLEDGGVSLTALSKLSPYLNETNHESLLEEAAGKSVREVEKIIVGYFPKAQVADSVKQSVAPLSVDCVHVHFSADIEFATKLEKAKMLLSKKYPEMKLSQVLGDGLDLLIKRHEPKRVEDCEVSGHEQQVHELNVAASSRYLSRQIKSTVFHRDDGKCSYKSLTGRICAERAFLEYDHIYPYSWGGKHESGNVRLLCRTHHKLLTVYSFGTHYISNAI